jgi:type IV pilus biogenesis protein CpaD/CtpE
MGQALTYVELAGLSVGAAYVTNAGATTYLGYEVGARIAINELAFETAIYVEATQPGLIQDTGDFIRAFAHAPPQATLRGLLIQIVRGIGASVKSNIMSADRLSGMGVTLLRRV